MMETASHRNPDSPDCLARWIDHAPVMEGLDSGLMTVKLRPTGLGSGIDKDRADYFFLANIS